MMQKTPENPQPKYLVISFPRCPVCGIGGQRAVLPIPHGGVNHKCECCGSFISVEADGFSETGNL